MPKALTGESSKDVLMGVSVTCIIFALSAYVPIIGFFCSLFIPLPILIYRTKLGRKKGASIPLAAMVLMIVVMGRFSIDLLFFFELMLLGFILSELMSMNLSVERTMILACGTILATSLLGLFFYGQITHQGMLNLASDYVANNLELTLMLYENMGMSEENIRMIANSLDQIQYVLLRIIPALAVASTLFVAWTSLLMSRPLLQARGLHYPNFGSLKMWKPPDQLVWAVIGCGLMLLIPESRVKLLGLNGLIALAMVYFFSGIAIISFYFEKKRFPRLLRVFLYSLIALQQFVLILIIGLGLFDVWFDFRRVNAPKPQ